MPAFNTRTCLGVCPRYSPLPVRRTQPTLGRCKRAPSKRTWSGSVKPGVLLCRDLKRGNVRGWPSDLRRGSVSPRALAALAAAK